MKLSNALIFTTFLFTVFRLGLAQDHAPSVEMCRADRNLWADQMTEYEYAETDYINKGLPNRSLLMGLTYIQLNNRAFELGQCAVVDVVSDSEYNHLVSRYSSARDDRFKFFVKRHNLYKQMLTEDTAGKRH
ncbi:MAG: hypothetical protein ACRD3K_01800 [Edaphobacter sp.]